MTSSRRVGATSLIMGSPDLVEASSSTLTRRSSRMLDGMITPEPLRTSSTGTADIPRVMVTSSTSSSIGRASSTRAQDQPTSRTGLGLAPGRDAPASNASGSGGSGTTRPLSAIKQHRSISALSLFAKSKASESAPTDTAGASTRRNPSAASIPDNRPNTPSATATPAQSRLPRPASMAGLRASMQAGVSARKTSTAPASASKTDEPGRIGIATRLGLRSAKNSATSGNTMARASMMDLTGRASRASAYGSDTIDEDNVLEVLEGDELGVAESSAADRQAAFEKLVGGRSAAGSREALPTPRLQRASSVKTPAMATKKLSTAPLTRMASMLGTRSKPAESIATTTRAKPLQETTKTPPQTTVPLSARRTVRSTTTPSKPIAASQARTTPSVSTRSSARAGVPFPKESSTSPKATGSSLAPPMVTPRARKISDIDARLERSMALNDDSPLHKVSPTSQIAAMENDSPQWSAGKASTGSVAARTRTSISANASPAAKLGRAQRLRDDELGTSTNSARTVRKQSPVPLRAVDTSARIATKRSSVGGPAAATPTVKGKPRMSQAQEESSALVEKVVQLTIQLQEAAKTAEALQVEKTSLEERLAAAEAVQLERLAQQEDEAARHRKALQQESLGSQWDAVAAACEKELEALQAEKTARDRLLATFHAELDLIETLP